MMLLCHILLVHVHNLFTTFFPTAFFNSVTFLPSKAYLDVPISQQSQPMAQISIYNCSFTLNQNKSMSLNERKGRNSSKQSKCQNTRNLLDEWNVISCVSRIPLNYSFLFHPSFLELCSALCLHRQYWLLYSWLPLCKKKSVFTLLSFVSLSLLILISFI